MSLAVGGCVPVGWLTPDWLTPVKDGLGPGGPGAAPFPHPRGALQEKGRHLPRVGAPVLPS